MASNPPEQCCTIGVKHSGTAKGEFKSVDGIDTYFTHSPNKSTTDAIVILTDVIGSRFINAQLIADQFAANGYFVVMPDLFAGDPIPLNRSPDFDMEKWRANKTFEVIDPIVEKILKTIKEEYGAKRIGTVGYCFGAKYVVRFLKKGVTEAGFVAHPSWVTTDELKGIQGPLSIAAAETDGIFPPPKRHETEQILKDLKHGYQINLFSGVSHGFAVKGDPSIRDHKFAKEQAFLQAVYWFNEHVKKA